MEEDETQKSPGSLASQARVRPQMSLRIPPTPGSGTGSVGSRPPTFYYTGPLTPTAIDMTQGGVNVLTMYPGKAGEFVSKQFFSKSCDYQVLHSQEHQDVFPDGYKVEDYKAPEDRWLNRYRENPG
ncbi:unnamed protein product, partial [Nesidiocoris tenuis]